MSKKTTQNCKYCSIEFQCYPSEKRIFCGNSCSSKHLYKKTKRIEYECVICKKNVVIRESLARASNQKTQTCGFECYKKYIKKNPLFCAWCKKEFIPRDHRTKTCSRECCTKYCTENGIRKKRGYWYENGYKILYKPNGGQIREHVYVIEQKYGRKLQKNEVVHHLNNIRDDNRPENLVIMKRGEHSIFHRKYEKECISICQELDRCFTLGTAIDLEKLKIQLKKALYPIEINVVK